VHVVQQAHQALRVGLLEPEDQLPTAQHVVSSLAINPRSHHAPRSIRRAIRTLHIDI
jgi:hypothetical protein